MKYPSGRTDDSLGMSSAREASSFGPARPPGGVGVAAVLPPPEREMPPNLRVVTNDAELRETLAQAGNDTVRLPSTCP